MDREFYENPKLPENPDYQKGVEIGSQALDPLSVLDTSSPVTDRKAFLAGYAVALKKYLDLKKVRLPIATWHKEDIDFPPYLFGIVTGLKREGPNTPMVFEFHGSGNPEDPQTWSDTSSWIYHRTKKNGYIIGFLAGLARDYGIITHCHAIPNDDTQYQVYLDGLTAKPSKYFLRKEQQSLGAYAPEAYDKRIYLTGLKVWLQEQGFGTIICPVLLTHPQTLAAFKEFIVTGIIPESEEKSLETQTGYELAKIALPPVTPEVAI